MTKQEFAEKLAAEVGISKATALQAIDCIFSTKVGEGIIATELDAGRPLTVTGFGTFATRYSKARRGRNPQTGQPIMIAARTSPSFRGSKGLKTRVADMPPKPVPTPVTERWEY
jgi:DNA-binding protein HU-beta